MKIIRWLLGAGSQTTGTFESVGLLILRLGAGLTMAFGHGLSKLASYSERSATFSDPLGVGSAFSLVLVVFAEMFCSLAVAIGLFTRATLIPLMITMGIAAFVIHADDPFRKKELALLYLLAFVVLFITGPGKFAIDRFFSEKLTRN